MVEPNLELAKRDGVASIVDRKLCRIGVIWYELTVLYLALVHHRQDVVVKRLCIRNKLDSKVPWSQVESPYHVL